MFSCSIYPTVIDNSYANYHTSSQDSGDTIIVKNGPFTASRTMGETPGVRLGTFVATAGSYLTQNAVNTFILSYDSQLGHISLMTTDPPIDARDTSDPPLNVDSLFVDSGPDVLSNWNVCGLGLGEFYTCIREADVNFGVTFSVSK